MFRSGCRIDPTTTRRARMNAAKIARGATLAPAGRMRNIGPLLLLLATACGDDGTGTGPSPTAGDASAAPPVDSALILDAAIDEPDVRPTLDAAPVLDAFEPADASAIADAAPAADSGVPPTDVGPMDPPDAGLPVVDCSRLPYSPEALLDEAVGFGRRAAGGDAGHLYRVTSLAASGRGTLRDGLESPDSLWIVFDVGLDATAVIDAGDEPIEVRSNKTVDGRGRDIVVDGGLVFREGTRNVVISDIRLTNTHGARCTQEADVVSIRGDGGTSPAAFGTRDIWFHHVEIYEGGDGLIDIRGGSRITISWSHFHDHSKGFLLSMESAGELEGREMEVTFHHNYFERISRRSPQLSLGRAHLFNNYQYQWWEFGAASIARAQLLSEGNIYEARPGAICGTFFTPCRDPAPCGDEDWEVSKIAVSNDWAADERGYVRSTGDLLLEDARVAVNEPGRVFTPDYPYVLEPATRELADRIRAESGPRVGYCR